MITVGALVLVLCGITPQNTEVLKFYKCSTDKGTAISYNPTLGYTVRFKCYNNNSAIIDTIPEKCLKATKK